MAATPTWAQVAKKKKPPLFLPTECAVDLEQFAAPQCLPPSSSQHSAFIPLPSVYKQGWALDIITQLPTSTVGMVPRADISLLEVCLPIKRCSKTFSPLRLCASTSRHNQYLLQVHHLSLFLLS